MNDSTDLAMAMRDRAGWTGTDPIVSVLLINGAKALEEAEREVAELRELVRKCRPMVVRSMMSSYRDAAPDETPVAVLRAIDKALSGNTPEIESGKP